MVRSRHWMLVVFLSLAVAGMSLYAEETEGGRNETPAPKRHSTKSKGVKSKLSGQPTQYGHIVLDDVRINAMGVRCTIKQVRLMYKGDGIDAGVVGNILANSEAEKEKLPPSLLSVPPDKWEKVTPKTPAKDEKEPAELKSLADEDGKKEVKVVLWTYMTLDPREEFIQADRRLANKWAEEIRRLSEENQQKITIVKPNLVEQYKSRHPNWQALELTTVGHDFNTDYVVCLEINKLSLYELNANQQIYRGQTEILVSLVDMKNPDEPQHKEFTDRYPSEAHGDMTPLDINAYQFREKFLEYAAKRLALYFVDHKKSTRMGLLDE